MRNPILLEELVPKEVFESHGEKAWAFVDPRLYESIETLSKRFPEGSMTINNWKWGGDRNWSGLRTPSALKWYSKTAQHALHPIDLVFRAVDIVWSDYTAEEVRQDIIDNPEVYPHIKSKELGISWNHIEVRPRDRLTEVYSLD